MKIKLGVNHLVVVIACLIFYKLYFLKFLYLLVAPGFCFLLLTRKYEFNKTLLFSVPLSLILFVYPYFLLTRVGLSINYYLYALIPAVVLIYTYLEKKPDFEFSQKVNVNQLILLLSILVVFFMIYNPFSFRKMIPLTEGSNELRAIIDVNEQILSYERVPHWGTEIFGSNHYFYVGPPLTTLSTSFLYLLNTEPVYATFNFSYTFLLLYLLFASYMLFRKLKLSIFGAAIATILVAGVPSIAGEITYAGNLTSSFMYAMFPVALYGFFSLFDEADKLDLIIYAIGLSAFFLTYHFQFIYFLYPAILTVGLFLFYGKNQERLFKNSFIYFGFAGLLILSWVVHIMFLAPEFEVMGMEGDWNQPLNGIAEFIDFITYTGQEDIHKMTTSMSPLFFYFGAAASMFAFRFVDKHLKVSRHDLIMLVFTLLAFFFIIVEIFPFHVLIPLRTKYYSSYRFWVTLVPLFAFGVGRFADTLSNYFKNSKIIILAVFLFAFSSMFIQSANYVDYWLRETAIVDRQYFSEVYDLVDPSAGRVAVFGMYGPAFIPSMARWTGASMWAGYNYERYSTKNYYNRLVLPLTKASADYLYENVNPVRVYNTFQKSWTNTIIYFSCTPTGAQALNITLQFPMYYLKNDFDCLKVLSLNSSFAESVVLSKVSDQLNKSQVINDLMTLPGAHSLVFVDEDRSDLEYANIIVDANLSNYDLETSPLTYHRLNDYQINVKGRPGYVLIKENYFPTWHAYQDGLELKIIQSYDGFMIVKSNSGSEIKLINQPHFVEWISLSIFSVLMILLGLMI